MRNLLNSGAFELSRGKYSVIVDWSKVSDEMLAQCAMHGLRQKMQDSYASSKELKLTPADCVANATAVRDAVYAGQWSERAVSAHPILRAFMDKFRKAAMASIANYDGDNKDHVRQVQTHVNSELAAHKELIDAQIKSFDETLALINA
jgi:hypothetical protein